MIAANSGQPPLKDLIDTPDGLVARQTSPVARTVSMRAMLVLFVLLVVTPAWCFAGYLAVQFALGEKQAVEAAGRSITRAVAASLDFRFASLEGGGEALALSASLQRDDLRAFRREATAVAGSLNAAVTLTHPDGKVIMDSRVGDPDLSAPLAETLKIEEAAKTGQAHYTSAYLDRVGQTWMLARVSPVEVDKVVRYVLVIAIDTRLHVQDALEQVDLPPGWVVSLLDQSLVIAGRRPHREQFVGVRAHPSVGSIIGPARQGTGVGASVDGQPVHAFYQRLEDAPWTMLAGVPRNELDEAVWRAVSPVVAAGLSVLALTILAAWLLGRGFTHDLARVSAAATAFRVRQDEASTAGQPRIYELASLKGTLEEAMAERRHYEAQLKSLLTDKDLLMQEVHHRVKNSLQLVRGILSLQARSAAHPEARSALQSAASRILTVADVHQHLYQGLSSSEVNASQYLIDLAKDLRKSLLDSDPSRDVTVSAPSVIWASEKIIALGLITTELVTNAIKYGAGRIHVELDIREDMSAKLVVEDEGRGFPEGVDLGQGGGLGSRLITSLVRPDEGQVSVDRSVPHGRVVVTLRPNWRVATGSA